MIQQVAFDVPKEIALGLASGEYVQYGGVVRDAAGHIVKHLEPVNVSNAATTRSRNTSMRVSAALRLNPMECPNSTKIRPFDSFESLLFASIQAMAVVSSDNVVEYPDAQPHFTPPLASARTSTPIVARTASALPSSAVSFPRSRFETNIRLHPRQVGNLLLRVAFRFAERPYRTPKIGRIVNFHIITSVIIQGFTE